MTPRVSIVIPAFRARRHLPACLEALAGQTADPDAFEVIVVDDASGDGTGHLARQAGVTVLDHERNRGAAAARNTGARAAKGDLLLFVDSDVVPAPGLVAAALRLADAGTAAATGRYDPEPAGPDDAFARYKALWTFWCWERSGARSGTSSHLQGALAAVRRDVFEEAGGFDESFVGGSVEDYELSERLREAGHTIKFDDGLRGRHHFPGFGTVARNYWDRARMWKRLRSPGDGFSSGQASRRAAVSAVCAATAAWSSPALPLSLPLVLAADAGWLAANAPFLLFVARREGAAFAAWAAVVHFALGVVVGTAAATTPFGRGSRL